MFRVSLFDGSCGGRRERDGLACSTKQASRALYFTGNSTMEVNMNVEDVVKFVTSLITIIEIVIKALKELEKLKL